ncbi:MAG: hypothetical protein JKY26_01455 [Pseudomonas sp.]|nr:hypothetical protein [Pseudomonas sp.]
MKQFYYGIESKKHAFSLVERVCDVLGGGVKAELILLETACAETQLGAFKDPTPNGAGRGLCQCDNIPFYDVIARTREKHILAIKEAFGLNLYHVKHEQLDNNPLLAFILCRLHYKLIPAVFPDNKQERAQYWKKYYNTVAGKGTAEHYLESVTSVLGGS